MNTFKTFLLESGHATSKFGVSRATKSDIQSVLKFVSKVTGLSVEALTNNLLGSTRQTLAGTKKDSGDIDIAFSTGDQSVKEKMAKAVNNEWVDNTGTKVASFAVPVNGKKVQVDFMFVNDVEWAKFAYHSSADSAYPGAVRNVILATAVTFYQEPGKDFVYRDGDRIVARASRSFKLSSGFERLFKIAKRKADGSFNKTLSTVSPDEVETFIKSDLKLDAKFDKSPDVITDPNILAKRVFSCSADDILTAEGVIAQIKKKKNAAEILAKCKSELTKAKLPIPKEL